MACIDEVRIPLKVVLLPKFEIGEMCGDYPGEAQFFFEHYLQDACEYEICGAYDSHPFYVRDGVGMFVTGMGKVNAALGLAGLLSDDRFDFADAYFMSIGCAGTAVGYGVPGDVVMATAAVDYDLGHHADIREMRDKKRPTWFHDTMFDGEAVRILDPALMDACFELVKDIPLETTEETRESMATAYDSADWAVRDPRVLRGTTMSSDNYWKGAFGHQNAQLMVQTYGCPDPYAASEMEDVALGTVLMRRGMLDRYIIVRAAVNMDEFVNGATPEMLWDKPAVDDANLEDRSEWSDIFATAMANNFKVGKVIVDAILEGRLEV